MLSHLWKYQSPLEKYRGKSTKGYGLAAFGRGIFALRPYISLFTEKLFLCSAFHFPVTAPLRSEHGFALALVISCLSVFSARNSGVPGLTASRAARPGPPSKDTTQDASGSVPLLTLAKCTLKGQSSMFAPATCSFLFLVFLRYNGTSRRLRCAMRWPARHIHWGTSNAGRPQPLFP